MLSNNRVSFLVGSTIQEPGDPSEVTEIMGVEPSEIVWDDLHSYEPESNRSETHPTWTWSIHSPLGQDEPASQRVSALIEALLPMEKEIHAIPKRYWRSISCMYDSTSCDFPILSDVAIILSVEDMRNLAKLNLDLWFNARTWTPQAYRAHIEKAESGPRD